MEVGQTELVDGRVSRRVQALSFGDVAFLPSVQARIIQLGQQGRWVLTLLDLQRRSTDMKRQTPKPQASPKDLLRPCSGA